VFPFARLRFDITPKLQIYRRLLSVAASTLEPEFTSLLEFVREMPGTTMMTTVKNNASLPSVSDGITYHSQLLGANR
jgi:hypothetical protein